MFQFQIVFRLACELRKCHWLLLSFYFGFQLQLLRFGFDLNLDLIWMWIRIWFGFGCYLDLVRFGFDFDWDSIWITLGIDLDSDLIWFFRCDSDFEFDLDLVWIGFGFALDLDLLCLSLMRIETHIKYTSLSFFFVQKCCDINYH